MEDGCTYNMAKAGSVLRSSRAVAFCVDSTSTGAAEVMVARVATRIEEKRMFAEFQKRRVLKIDLSDEKVTVNLSEAGSG